MYNVTTELKKNKKLRTTILDNINFKAFNTSDHNSYYSSSNPSHSFLGTVYEVCLFIQKIKFEKDSYRISQLNSNRGYSILRSVDLSSVDKKTSRKVRAWIKQYNSSIRILVDLVRGYSVSSKKVVNAILFISFISLFREPKQIFYFKPKYNSSDFSETKKFLKSIDKKFVKSLFKNERKVSFNQLITAGYLAGEIDILSSSRIIDIKTVNSSRFTNDMIIQLVLYYFLARQNEIYIKDLSILFSKFGHLETINTKKLFKKKGKKKILKRLEKDYYI